MTLHGLLKNCEFRWLGLAVAAANNTDDNSSRIDMRDYEGVTFVTTIDDSVNTGVAALKAESNDDDSDTGMAAVSGAQHQVVSAADDDLNNKLLIVEVNRPAKRYVQAVRTSATANIAFGPVLAILRPKLVPAVQGATVHSSPAVVSD